MKCLRCSTEMRELANHGVKLNVCIDGCGGIWFDQHEYKKLDEAHEGDPQFISQLSQAKKNKVDLNNPVNCPSCKGVKLMRRFSSVKRETEIDECPSCAGIWLDAGELLRIHAEFKTDNDRKKAATDLFDQMFGQQLAQQKELKAKKFNDVKNILRFICPSYYISGKQSWGAF